MRSATVEPTHEKEQPSRLAELLACEEELAALMRDAREEARRRVDFARRATERAALELGASLEEEAERARREIEEASRTQAVGILTEARGKAARFDGVTDEEVERLAASALRLLLEL